MPHDIQKKKEKKEQRIKRRTQQDDDESQEEKEAREGGPETADAILQSFPISLSFSLSLFIRRFIILVASSLHSSSSRPLSLSFFLPACKSLGDAVGFCRSFWNLVESVAARPRGSTQSVSIRPQIIGAAIKAVVVVNITFTAAVTRPTKFFFQNFPQRSGSTSK